MGIIKLKEKILMNGEFIMMDLKKGDKVMLLDIAPNRYICSKYNIDLFNKIGVVDEVEFYENRSELVAIFDELMINVRIFPIWIKL